MTLCEKGAIHKEDFMPFPVFSYLESCRFEIQQGREHREKLEEERGEAGERERDSNMGMEKEKTERVNLKINWISSALYP